MQGLEVGVRGVGKGGGGKKRSVCTYMDSEQTELMLLLPHPLCVCVCALAHALRHIHSNHRWILCWGMSNLAKISSNTLTLQRKLSVKLINLWSYV